MQKMTAINIDKWRDVNGGLIISYLDCYYKLSVDNSLNKADQLYKSLMMFAPTRTASADDLYSTAYTIARELGIFYEEDDKFYLSNSAKKIIEQPSNAIYAGIEEYMCRYALNTEFLINNIVIHPTNIIASYFKSNEFSLEEASLLTELIPTNEVSSSSKDCLNKFLKRLVLSRLVEIKDNGNYQFINYQDTINRCTFSQLSPIDFENKFIGNKNHKNVVLYMIDRGLDVSNNIKYNTISSNQNIGYNKIIYGAPGAGKSKSIIDIIGDHYIRTVFHPETQNSDFIGCLKPHKDHAGNITYSFRKGPFIRILEQALLHPDKHYFLVIEELNRANTAAVFGEVFQLLDRDEYGNSEYPISIQDEDLFDALTKDELGNASVLSENEYIAKRKLIIPNNLSIIATMNSSDQAVFPLDTAFKRRWIFEYLPIDFTNSANGLIPTNDLNHPNIEWKKLAQGINQQLVKLEVVEDKLIGPWFIKNSDLADKKTARETFIGKICSYLWDDALKYKDKSKIFDAKIQGYGQLHQMYMSGQPILANELIEQLMSEEPKTENPDEFE